jgi:hypothetical protein
VDIVERLRLTDQPLNEEPRARLRVCALTLSECAKCAKTSQNASTLSTQQAPAARMPRSRAKPCIRRVIGRPCFGYCTSIISETMENWSWRAEG